MNNVFTYRKRQKLSNIKRKGNKKLIKRKKITNGFWRVHPPFGCCCECGKSRSRALIGQPSALPHSHWPKCPLLSDWATRCKVALRQKFVFVFMWMQFFGTLHFIFVFMYVYKFPLRPPFWNNFFIIKLSGAYRFFL